ncbi:MAG: EamA family transporter [Chitinophagaceae bacterium]|nr:MAG: EamA family transporter [Chitinophagaceae bacterium]
MKNFKYYLAAISAFAIWGSFALVLKPIHDWPSLDILFYRVFICAVVMSSISLLFKRKKLAGNIRQFRELPAGRKRSIAWLNIAGSVFLTANWLSFIFVMNHISVRATSVAYLICPILTTILAFFILREKLTRLQWFSVALSCLACVILSYNNLRNIVYSTVIGLTYACYLITQKSNQGFDKFLVLNVHMLLSALVLIPFFPAFAGPVPVDLKFYGLVAVIAVAYTILPLFLNLYALGGINSSSVGTLMNINPIIVFVLSVAVYHEPLDSAQVFCYSLIFLAVVLFNISNFRQLQGKKSGQTGETTAV